MAMPKRGNMAEHVLMIETTSLWPQCSVNTSAICLCRDGPATATDGLHRLRRQIRRPVLDVMLPTGWL